MSAVEEMHEADTHVLAAVERALGAFGESAKKSILWHLSRRGVATEDIPRKPNLFMQMLAEMFGDGAGVIESLIVRNIKRDWYPLRSSTFPGVMLELRGVDLNYDGHKPQCRFLPPPQPSSHLSRLYAVVQEHVRRID